MTPGKKAGGKAEAEHAEARQALLAREFHRALPRYEKLVRLRPGGAVLWFEYGNAALGLRQTELAVRAWRKALELAPGDAELIGLIGHQFQGLRRPDAAEACFAQAAAADPRAINPRISLAVLHEKTHRLAEARRQVEACLAIDPADDQGRYFAAVLDRREGRFEEAERRLRDLTASAPRHPFVRYACRYELAQLLDRRDACDEAMRWLGEAKTLVRGLTDTRLLTEGYDAEAARLKAFLGTFPKNAPELWAETFPVAARQPSPPLVFLGGHPRSGTTLLEQVLDAHPDVVAFDESPAFKDVLQPDCYRLPNARPGDLNRLRKEYLADLAGEADGAAGGKTLVDKNPSPTSRLSVWLRVFPEIRVLIALRDPRDVILSCYFQNIPLNSTNVNFLSFERLARHYADLMDVWLTVREWSGYTWLETRYEDMVQDLEKEGRRVGEFLGLAWHDEQARFYEGSRRKQLYSPTYQDVTRPVYTRSVARWRAYEKFLAPILPALEPYCRRLGYA